MQRMSIPEGCPKRYSKLMKKCWSSDINARPNFNEIVNKLDEIFIPLIREKQ